MHHFGHSWGSPRAKAKMWLRFLAIRIFGGTRLKTLRQLAKALFERGGGVAIDDSRCDKSRTWTTHVACEKLTFTRQAALRRFGVGSALVQIKVREQGILQLGPHVTIGYHADVHVGKGATISVGEQSYLGPRCMLSAQQSIEIGPRCLARPDLKIFDNNHVFKPSTGVVRGAHSSSKVTIGTDVWIGANVVILKGVAVGDRSVIGAGVVLRHDVPAGSIIAAGSCKVRPEPIRP